MVKDEGEEPSVGDISLVDGILNCLGLSKNCRWLNVVRDEN